MRQLRMNTTADARAGRADAAMFDHISLGVTDLEASRDFYLAALAPPGIGVVMELSAEQTGGEPAFAFGSDGRPRFWIGRLTQVGMAHLAFSAPSRAAVDAFHAAAIAAGARDNGAPGPRPWYAPDYYGAFVIDLNGVNLEAVHRGAA